MNSVLKYIFYKFLSPTEIHETKDFALSPVEKWVCERLSLAINYQKHNKSFIDEI